MRERKTEFEGMLDLIEKLKKNPLHKNTKAALTQVRNCTLIEPVQFFKQKILLFTRVLSVLVPVLSPIHTGTQSYQSVTFRAKTNKM